MRHAISHVVFPGSIVAHYPADNIALGETLARAAIAAGLERLQERR